MFTSEKIWLHWLVDWLIYWLIGWLIDWLIWFDLIGFDFIWFDLLWLIWFDWLIDDFIKIIIIMMIVIIVVLINTYIAIISLVCWHCFPIFLPTHLLRGIPPRCFRGAFFGKTLRPCLAMGWLPRGCRWVFPTKKHWEMGSFWKNCSNLTNEKMETDCWWTKSCTSWGW